MPQPDLDLVQTQDLVTELIKRHDCVVIVGLRHGVTDGEIPLIVRMGSSGTKDNRLHADVAIALLNKGLEIIEAARGPGGHAD